MIIFEIDGPLLATGMPFNVLLLIELLMVPPRILLIVKLPVKLKELFFEELFDKPFDIQFNPV